MTDTVRTDEDMVRADGGPARADGGTVRTGRGETVPATPGELRRLVASGAWTGPTAGLLDGYQQANLVVVPYDLAFDFLLYCTRNPAPCPVIAVTEPGDPVVRLGGTEADLRTALPRYRVWRRGRLVEEPHDITEHWRDDAVGFLLGCSHTFEGPLRRAGVPVRYAADSSAPAVYVTDVATRPAGRLSGPLVVSGRAIPAGLVARAVEVTARYPTGHGAPVHIGDPAAIGIADLARPDFGPPPVVEEGDTMVFWACGVTPQLVLPAAAADYTITHYPGHMFVFDHTVDLADAV
ncbi:putative hydro-lyase [Streptomyces sp. NRRL F-5135]|uniref:putative hydro-lyase n=1 Tax=Streptomyces sp. NRRL F-5135 TaxID=1463858 RepID=UPI000A3EC9F1|nr:putative hydro-lyase [Streptomyces sp. NRRL F-5135]